MDACSDCAMVPMSRREQKIARLERAAGIPADREDVASGNVWPDEPPRGGESSAP
jgi:hypothetical protein